MRRISRKLALALAIATFTVCVLSHSVADSIATAKSAAWIARSNENTNLLVKAESAEQCTDQATVRESLLELNPKFVQCYEQNLNNTIKTLQTKLNQEKDPSVKIDLEILIGSASEELRSDALDRKYRVPYVNLTKEITASLGNNQKDALKRVQRFVGNEPGTTPIAELAIAQLREAKTRPNAFFPEKSDVQQDLASQVVQLDQLKQRLEQLKIDPKIYTKLKTQLTEYATVVRQEILPQARTNFRLPPELYAARLAERGVEVPIDTIVQDARTAFTQIQQQMNTLAPQVAKQKGSQASNYRDVIRLLKQEQLPTNEILEHYQQRQKQIERIVQREKLVTLPKRSLTIRLTNDRENSDFPVPQYFPPKASQKTAGVFIIPVLKQTDKSTARAYDDFTYPAVSWTLTAHEGRPGHDLQFTTIQDKGVSDARSRFGYNPANHEGWALYAETITLPFMPIDGQFISLQFQLLRAARAFLEPELHLGKISTDEALRVLTEDVGFSKFFAQQEIKRYTVRLPGHAPSYFYGYQRLMQLRTEVEQKFGQKFDRQKFHDFILSQGFMPQRLLRQAVLEQYVN